MIKDILKRVKDIYSYPCITIQIETHRTRPKNQQDPIALKNMIQEVEDRLSQEMDSSALSPYLQKLHQIADSLDHNHNLKGLVIFVNEAISEFVRLPLKVANKTFINHTFATRELVRAMHREENYYILSLNQQKAHLYEAFADTVVREVEAEGFPMENPVIATTKLEKTMDTADNLVKEFFNQVDKSFQRIYHQNPASLILAGVERNIAYFREVSDDTRSIIGSLNGNYVDQSQHQLAQAAWQVVTQATEESRKAALQELDKAIGQQKLASSLDDIWTLVQQGRGELLLLEEGYYQAAIDRDGKLELVEEAKEVGVIDDIVDEIVEYQLRFKGRVVFMPDGELKQFDRIALTLRY